MGFLKEFFNMRSDFFKDHISQIALEAGVKINEDSKEVTVSGRKYKVPFGNQSQWERLHTCLQLFYNRGFVWSYENAKYDLLRSYDFNCITSKSYFKILDEKGELVRHTEVIHSNCTGISTMSTFKAIHESARNTIAATLDIPVSQVIQERKEEYEAYNKNINLSIKFNGEAVEKIIDDGSIPTSLKEKEQPVTKRNSVFAADIDFLKDLQKELNELGRNKAPVLWTIVDIKEEQVSDDKDKEYTVVINNETGERFTDIRQYIDHAIDMLKGKEGDHNAEIDFLNSLKQQNTTFEYVTWRAGLDDKVEIINVKQLNYTVEDLVFLTQQEAADHIVQYHHRYSLWAKIRPISVSEAPKVERLLNILKNFDFSEIT